MNEQALQVPIWYCGERLRESLAHKTPLSDLSGHVLDEIIDNILDNPETFRWEGPDGLANCLDVNQKTLKSKLWIWNSQKIRFAKYHPIFQTRTSNGQSSRLQAVKMQIAAGSGIAPLLTVKGVDNL